MLHNNYLKDWSKIVSYHFPHLSLPEVAGLATWSFGMVITSSSSLTRVSEFIAKVNGEKSNTVRKRLKEWYQDSKAKKGKKRKELDVSKCFVPLLKWILSLWNSQEKWLPLAIDATNIGQNFTVLSLHVLYQGCGIPVAWKIIKGNEKGSWIESSYRDLKSDGWQWHKTRLRDPLRAERIWLAMAVATLWTLTMGSQPQKYFPETVPEEMIANHKGSEKSLWKKVNRSISCFLQGLINIVANLICGKGIYLNDLFPRTSFAVNTS